MESPTLTSAETKFSSPEEELQYLREKIAQKERELSKNKEQFTREEVIKSELKDYKSQVPAETLSKGYALMEPHVDAIVLNLVPETHDIKMAELLGILQEKGIMNALQIVEKLNNPHIEDDFHRFLVEYIKEGFPVEGLKEKTILSKALRHTLYEVSLPSEAENKEEKQKQLKELLSSMEQFYAGMLSVSEKQSSLRAEENFFTIELSNAIGSQEFIFYVSVPDSKRDLFEKQLLSIFPRATITLQTNDYNIFTDLGATAGSFAFQSQNPIFPIKTYEQFDYDPLNIILNTFSKLEQHGEGAAIQLVFNPAGDYYTAHYKEALGEIQKGVPLKKAIDIKHSFLGELFKTSKNVATDLAKSNREEEKPPRDEKAIENIQAKISSPVAEVNLRIVTSAKTEFRASEILSDIQSAFNQFDNTIGNTVRFRKENGAKLAKLVRDFSFRVFSKEEKMELNLKEATSLMHFPAGAVRSAELRSARAATAPAPLDLASDGILIGINRHRNLETKIFMSPEDRLRHFYTVGQTGTGKTTFLKNMIIQDIRNGDGVCMIDPHGSDIQEVLANVPPERYEDVVYFDPSYTPRPMALNMLEYDPRYPEQKTFVVNEMLSIFNKLFDMKVAGGPMFEQYFRNATMLVIEDPESGNTLLDVSRVLAQKSFREMKLSRCKNPIVVQFWRDIAEKAGGESSLANIVPYITSKFDVFLSNEIMRPIIAQEHSSFNFREIMDNRKILLVNLAKGRLGDINANLIGLILVGKILMSALSRVDSLGRDLPPFYLYIDEFQNITTDSIATILSEARKYKLSLTIAHQFIKQLEEKIKDAVFGNVGTIASFRVGSEDAEFLEKQFAPIFSAHDLMNVDNHNAYIKMLSHGKPVKPFSIEQIGFLPKGEPEITDKLKELSYLKFGSQRAEVEEKIMEKYRTISAKPSPML
ncbi:MAG TPA: TraM recognition domain-containing protein [Candidatus Paceibacterota bacterium]|nr:TraM recognition domain-containing protein [Candidatus Paceibacterota bacterium]